MVSSTQTIITDDVLALAKKELKNVWEKWRNCGGICYGTTLNCDGSELQMGKNTCHIWLSHAYCYAGFGRWKSKDKYPEGAGNFLCLSCHDPANSQCTKDAAEALVNWVARESPFSEYVLNRDDDESLLNYGIILLCGKDGLTQAQAMWVCKTIRQCKEGKGGVDTWHSLVQAGVNPMVALFIASEIRTVVGATFGYTGANDHGTVFTYSYDTTTQFTPRRLKGMVSGKINPAADKTYHVFEEVPLSKSLRLPDLKSLCSKHQISDGWGGAVEGSRIPKENLIKFALDMQKPYLNQEQEERIKMPDSNTVYLDLDM